MHSLVLLLLFVGMFMVVHGVYNQKFRALKDNVRVEYRFIPRTYYDEQLSDSDVSGKFENMFKGTSPWQVRNIGTCATATAWWCLPILVPSIMMMWMSTDATPINSWRIPHWRWRFYCSRPWVADLTNKQLLIIRGRRTTPSMGAKSFFCFCLLCVIECERHSRRRQKRRRRTAGKGQ